MPHRFRYRFPAFVCGITVLIGMVARPVVAQISYPMLMSLKPVAAQAGQTSEHTIHARYSMFGAYQVLVSGQGVTGEIVHPPAKPEDEQKKPDLLVMPVRFTVAPDAEPGVRDFRIATPNGVSTVGQLVIVRDPVVVETANNDKPDQAQLISLPATVCGAIEKAEDVDFFKFHVDAGVSLVFHVRSSRLEDRIHDLQQHSDPIITLRTAAGNVLASNDNYFFGDPLLSHRFEQAGDYLLEIRDARYFGNQYWEYCIEINSRPFVESVFPLAVTRGQPAQLQLVGFQLAADPLVTCSTPMDAPMGAHQLRLPMGSDTTNPISVHVTDLPLVAETADDNNSFDKAQPITVPAGVNARLESEADVDCFAFEAKQGETFSFEVVARRRQSCVDSYLRILNDKGQQLAVNDDLRLGKRGYADSWLENWAAPAAGRFVIEIRDVHLRGGPQFPYFLKVTRSQPYFELYLDTDKTPVTPGGSGAIFCRVERKCGFTGEVQLHIDGLPPGITASCGRILADKGQDGCIVLAADHDASLAAANVTVTGTATHTLADGQLLPLAATASTYQEIYQPGGGRGHWPADSHTVAVTSYGDLRYVTLSDYDITLKPGESKKIEITLDRSPGFNQNVTLDMLYQHLGSIYGNSLPLGVTLDDKEAKTLISGEASQGHITLKAAADAPPVERQQSVVMANVSLNFVMKATYTSRPVTISIVKP